MKGASFASVPYGHANVASAWVCEEILAQIKQFFSVLVAKDISRLRQLFVDDLSFCVVTYEERSVRRSELSQCLAGLKKDPYFVSKEHVVSPDFSSGRASYGMGAV